MTTVAVLGASGGVGRRIVAGLLARGHRAICQTRSADRLTDLGGDARVVVFDPSGRSGHDDFLDGADAVVFALGNRKMGRTTVFSDATRALLEAMKVAGVDRLIAITGVGAGDTRGHGGFIYNRIVFPLITRPWYADKEVQERMIAGSGLDWTIVRPAPFRKTAPAGPLRVVTEVPADLQLTAITRDEVADFIISEIEAPRHIHERPFIGHA